MSTVTVTFPGPYENLMDSVDELVAETTVNLTTFTPGATLYLQWDVEWQSPSNWGFPFGIAKLRLGGTTQTVGITNPPTVIDGAALDTFIADPGPAGGNNHNIRASHATAVTNPGGSAVPLKLIINKAIAVAAKILTATFTIGDGPIPPPLSASITGPPPGGISPSDPLVFEILGGGGTLTALTAKITQADGTPVLAYNLGFVNGFGGNDDDPITGGNRYTINAPEFGWPLGPLRLDVAAKSSDGTTTFVSYDGSAEDDSTTNSTGTITKDLIIDGTVLPTGVNALSLVFTQGQEEGDNGTNGGFVTINVGPSVVFPFTGDNQIWTSLAGAAINSWTDVSDASVFGGANSIAHFTNPNPSGAFHLFFYCSTGSGGASPAGFRNFKMEVRGPGSSVGAARTWSVVAAGAYVNQARSRVIIQYRESPKLLAEIAAHAFIGQQIDDCLQVIPTLDDPALAGGNNLDVDGEIVGEGRTLSNGDIADDAEYRILIGARITRNNGRVMAPEYLAALVQFFGAIVVLTDHGGMSISYVVLRQPTADEIAILNEDIVARPMGVQVTRTWAPTNYFGFNNDPHALGFSDHTGTVGGVLAREF